MIGAVVSCETAPAGRCLRIAARRTDRPRRSAVRSVADAHDASRRRPESVRPVGILKVRNEVEKLRKRVGALEHALQRVGNQSLFVGIDREIARLICVEGLNRAEIRRIFQYDVIAGIEKDLSDQVETLLRTVDDLNALGIENAPEAAREPLRNPDAHLGNAFGHAVLQRGRPEPFHDGACASRDSRGRKEFGCRQTSAKRDHVGLLRDLEHLADRRGAQVRRALRELRGSRDGRHGRVFSRSGMGGPLIGVAPEARRPVLRRRRRQRRASSRPIR